MNESADHEPPRDCYGNDLTKLIERRHLDRSIRKLQHFWRYTRRYQRIAFQKWRAGARDAARR